jgi:hypothetical protein
LSGGWPTLHIPHRVARISAPRYRRRDLAIHRSRKAKGTYAKASDVLGRGPGTRRCSGLVRVDRLGWHQRVRVLATGVKLTHYLGRALCGCGWDAERSQGRPAPFQPSPPCPARHTPIAGAYGGDSIVCVVVRTGVGVVWSGSRGKNSVAATYPMISTPSSPSPTTRARMGRSVGQRPQVSARSSVALGSRGPSGSRLLRGSSLLSNPSPPYLAQRRHFRSRAMGVS